mgnify:CR=1 FL=1
MAVHPHVCGERNGYLRFPMAFGGSSPRLWGTVKAGQVADGACRFIPTSVGNGPFLMRSCTQSAVHPHVCGERIDTHNGILTTVGSSPRLWGTEVEGWTTLAVMRFIPTSVGNGEDMDIPIWDEAVHPHVCGERL